MKIFVAYGYNERDKWIENLVFPLIEAFGAEVVTGEGIYDGAIPDAVRNQIRRSDALIAFMTKRNPQDENDKLTHRWVIEELAVASAIDSLKRRTVEVCEKGVDEQGGMMQANQRIIYDETARDECLVKIAKAIGVWQSAHLVRVQLLPEAIKADLHKLLRDEGLVCSFRVKSGHFTDDYTETEIEKIGNGLFIHIPQPKANEYVQISIKHGRRIWESSYESLNSYGINLEEEI